MRRSGGKEKEVEVGTGWLEEMEIPRGRWGRISQKKEDNGVGLGSERGRKQLL